MSEKTTLTSIGKLDYFKDIFQKLMCENILTFNESSYILNCSLLFISEYKKNKNKTQFLELAYYIVAKYSITYNDYQPLYDFSFNYGFYPTVKFINDNELIFEKSILDIINEVELNKFKYGEIVETYHQNQKRVAISKNDWKEVSFIAPTSFGKSSIITDLLKINAGPQLKHAIIVPTKSLLMQTFRNVRNEKLDGKIILHDEMFEDDESFIGVFTQERAIRLLEKVEWGYDYLYIDEAHNILNDDARSILLTRLIKLNKLKNPYCKIIYLSPLLSSSESLKINNNQEIVEYKINQNIKLPEYYLFDENKNVFKYNKYFNSKYPIRFEKNFISYIKSTSSNKNLLYFNRPKEIDNFVDEFSSKIQGIRLSTELRNTIKTLKNYVHKSFNMIDYLSKGIMYLHGKLPEYIKDYLEYKFRNIDSIKFLVANSVLLEGVNLPISSLFILDSFSLDSKKLTNLVGRVNRLSEIYSKDGNLKLLFPQIHFVQSNYNKDKKMENYLKRLRETTVIDEIENPLLDNYVMTKNESKERKVKAIIYNENIYFNAPQTDLEKLQQNLISLGLQEVYNITNALLEMIINNINACNEEYEENAIIRISKVFIRFEYDIIDYEVRRLKEEKAQTYYKNFIKYTKMNSLKRNILSTIKNFKKQRSRGRNLVYIGKSYGELNRDGNISSNYNENVFVNIQNFSDKKLVNLAIIKLKMEEDFISFKLSKFIELALIYKIITQDEYDELLYGTSLKDELKLMKQGLPSNLFTKLKKDSQIDNIYFNENNMACGNEKFKEYFNLQDDFYKFQIDKFIII